jgi:hypothetical protein
VPVTPSRVPGERRRSRSEDPGPRRESTREARHDIALRDSCAGSRVSFRSRKSARCTRPGQEGERRGAVAPLNLIHLSNSPSQRFACPLNLARGAAFLSFPFSPTGSGAPRRRQLVALAKRDQPTLLRRGARPAGRARLSALHRGDFGPGAALPSPALPPENAFSELLAAQVIVPGGRGPEPPGAHGYEPPPQDATPRSASRTVSRNARHPSGDRNLLVS